MRRLLVLILLFWGTLGQAASLQYDFSYTFTDGEQLYGSLMGTLLSDDDTIQVDGLLDLHYTAPLRNDCCLPDFSYDTLAPWSGPGVVSLSGATMDFASEPPAAYQDAWALTASATIFDAYFDITCLEFCGEYVQGETFNAASWQIAAVPVPPAFLLFASGIGVLGWLRKRRA